MGEFFIHCGCGVEFSKSSDYVTHRATRGRECAFSPVFGVSARGSGSQYADDRLQMDKRLAAFFGDLDHKREVAMHYQGNGSDVQSFFDGKHMAWYVLSKTPELVDVVGHVKPSVKTLATIFEYHFHVSLPFRLAYLRWLPLNLSAAPTVDADGCLPPGDEAAQVTLADTVDVLELQVSKFILPLRQRNPFSTLPPGDPNHIFDWANEQKYWRAYPELMGYNRQAAFRTAGDLYPWFFSSVARYDGDGCLRIDFPAARSPFDGEENNPSLGQLDGLSHWQNEPHIVGFRVAIWALSSMVTFEEAKHNGANATFDIAKAQAFRDGLYINFRGPAKRRAYFEVQRFVVWQDGNPTEGPRPQSPGPLPHDDL